MPAIVPATQEGAPGARAASCRSSRISRGIGRFSSMQRTNLVACWQGCGRFADVWITAGTEHVVDDLDRGVMICGRCIEENEPLPLLIRDDLRAAAALVGK